MNSWNSDLVHSLYEKQILGYVTRVGGKVRLQPTSVAEEIRRLVREEGADPDDESVLAQARASVAAKPAPAKPTPRTSFAYLLLWISEVGTREHLDGLLEYLHARKNPMWEKGGLLYPRDDTLADEDGNEAELGTFAANACIPYARLNVRDGQKTMFERPWTRELLAARPFVDDIRLEQGVDCLRATWDDAAAALIFTGRTWHVDPVTVPLAARNLPAGTWAVYVNGDLRQTVSVESGSAITAEVVFGAEDVDVVFKRVG